MLGSRLPHPPPLTHTHHTTHCCLLPPPQSSKSGSVGASTPPTSPEAPRPLRVDPCAHFMDAPPEDGVLRSQCKYCGAVLSTSKGAGLKQHMAACGKLPDDVRAGLDAVAVWDAKHHKGAYGRNPVYSRFHVVGYRRSRCRRCNAMCRGGVGNMADHLRRCDREAGVSTEPAVAWAPDENGTMGPYTQPSKRRRAIVRAARCVLRGALQPLRCGCYALASCGGGRLRSARLLWRLTRHRVCPPPPLTTVG